MQGPIKEVIIKATSNWGMVFSFPHEKDLWFKYEEAKRIRLEIAKANAAEVKTDPMDQKLGKFDYYVPPRMNKISGWGAGQGTLTKRHICPKCQQEFSLRDVVPVTRSSVSQGKCPWCGREKPRI